MFATLCDTCVAKNALASQEVLKSANDSAEVCRRCGKHFASSNLHYGKCIDCNTFLRKQNSDLESQQAAKVIREPFKIILTTESSSSLPITERLDIVSAECVLGMNLFKDLGAGLRDIFGGRSASYQDALREARVTVLDEVRRQAADLGADAVVAISLDYSEISGGGKSMLFLVATGTAVKLADVPLSV